MNNKVDTKKQRIANRLFNEPFHTYISKPTIYQIFNPKASKRQMSQPPPTINFSGS